VLALAEQLCRRVAQVLAALGLTALILFAVATVLDGLLRFFDGEPIVLVGDAGSLLVAAAVASCFPLAQLQRANITIDLAGMALGPRMARALRTAAGIVVLIALAAMARQMARYAGEDASAGDTTVMLGIVTAPFWYVVAAMFACATIGQALVVALDMARWLGEAR
jgi:TRAP-type C4-dicarboxylate transport system permease small subunit